MSYCRSTHIWYCKCLGGSVTQYMVFTLCFFSKIQKFWTHLPPRFSDKGLWACTNVNTSSYLKPTWGLQKFMEHTVGQQSKGREAETLEGGSGDIGATGPPEQCGRITCANLMWGSCDWGFRVRPQPSWSQSWWILQTLPWTKGCWRCF